MPRKEAAIAILIIVIILALQSCASANVQPTASLAAAPLDRSTPVTSTAPTPLVETPECAQTAVPPIIVDAQPSPARPGNEVKIIGTGGYVQDSCGGINESARSFILYLDNEPVGDLICYVNRCEAKINLPISIASTSHCVSTQKDVCEFQFQVAPE